jgi:hypothetical protein
MTRRAYWLMAGAYLLLAIGAVVSVTLLARQGDQLDTTNRRLIAAAVGYCQAGIAPDAQERQIIDAQSRGTYDPASLDPICERFARQLEGIGHEEDR